MLLLLQMGVNRCRRYWYYNIGNPATYYQVDLINVRLEQIAIQRQIIQAGIKGDYQTRLNLANLLNQSTIPDVAPEENLQRMIEYFTKFEQEGIQSFIPSEITTLESIAHQCPFQGGPAVYIARALYKMINDSVEYNDDAVCLLDGIYRSGKADSNLNEFVLMPNPANESVQVAYINNEASIQSIKLIDIAGREIFNITLNDPFRSYNLSTKALTSGIYRVIVESTYGSVSSKNLVVSH